ncbi:hypothetical protein ABIB50_004394 [Mucilaginibacter sp. UYCu711]
MIKKSVLTLIFLVISTTILLAQGPLPGGDCSDLDDPACMPLDNGVIIFALTVLIATTLYLRRKQIISI